MRISAGYCLKKARDNPSLSESEGSDLCYYIIFIHNDKTPLGNYVSIVTVCAACFISSGLQPQQPLDHLKI